MEYGRRGAVVVEPPLNCFGWLIEVASEEEGEALQGDRVKGSLEDFVSVGTGREGAPDGGVEGCEEDIPQPCVMEDAHGEAPPEIIVRARSEGEVRPDSNCRATGAVAAVRSRKLGSGAGVKAVSGGTGPIERGDVLGSGFVLLEEHNVDVKRRQ